MKLEPIPLALNSEGAKHSRKKDMGPNERQKLEWLLGIKSKDLENAERNYAHIGVLKFLHAQEELNKLVCKRALTLKDYFQATSLLGVIREGVSFRCGCKECSSHDREALSTQREMYLKKGESFNLLKEKFLSSGIRKELEEDLAYELIKKSNSSTEADLKIAKTFAASEPSLCVLENDEEKYWLLAEDSSKKLYILPNAVAALMVNDIKEIENVKDLESWQIETAVSLFSTSFSLEKAAEAARSL